MTKDEALRLALEALENSWTEPNNEQYEIEKEAITAIKDALEAKDEPVGKLQEPTVERAWFTVAELNAWADKKLLENPQWVMPKDEPERDEPPPQRTWVGLTDEEFLKACQLAEAGNYLVAFQRIQEWLKEKNHA